MWFTCGFTTRPLNGVNLILAGYCIPFNIYKLLTNGRKCPFGMPPTHNSSSEVELEFCKRIIRNGLKQQKCQAYYTITRSGTAYFICSGPRQFLTGTVLSQAPNAFFSVSSLIKERKETLCCLFLFCSYVELASAFGTPHLTHTHVDTTSLATRHTMPYDPPP